MAGRLKTVEVTLKEMAQKLSHFQQQRDVAQLELKKVSSELEKARTRCSHAEREKVKAEYVLKSEIKGLLSKLSDKETQVGRRTSALPCSQRSRELRSISTNDLHSNARNRRNTVTKGRAEDSSASVSFFTSSSAIEKRVNHVRDRSSLAITAKGKKPELSSRPAVVHAKTRRELPETSFRPSPNPIAKSLNYFVKNTPLRRTNEDASETHPFCEAENDMSPQECTHIHTEANKEDLSPEEDMSAERIVKELGREFAHRTEADEGCDRFPEREEAAPVNEGEITPGGGDERSSSTFSPAEQSIPIPRTTLKNLSRFSDNYDIN